MKLDRLRLIGQWLGCDCPDVPIAGFTVDSRQVEKGFLFFALKGVKFDGHDFLGEVASRGAVAAVVDRSYQGMRAGLVLLPVDNVVFALQQLAKEVQKSRSQRIIGVTGSFGKTTTKEFIATLLSQKWRVAKTPGNSNSQVGLPLAILRASGEEEVFVVEMGMSEAGEIQRLVQIAPPEIAVITKIGHAHLDSFANGLDGIASAKAEILSNPSTKWGVIEQGAFQYTSIQQAGGCPKLTYGVSPAVADVTLEPGWILKDRGEESPSFRLPFSESHFCENFTGAAATATLMGLSWEEMARGFNELKSIPLRFEKIERQGITFINDCYNANLESMFVALNNLPRPSFGAKTIAVFGEISGLGKYSEEGHRQVGKAALDKVEHLLCYGKGCMPMVELFEAAGRPADFYRDLKELKKAVFELSKPGDVVLIKGSNQNKLWQILDYYTPIY